MGREHERRFWKQREDYHDLAQSFEDNIEVTHPPRAKGDCRWLCGRCFYAASEVTYREYRGPRKP